MTPENERGRPGEGGKPFDIAGGDRNDLSTPVTGATTSTATEHPAKYSGAVLDAIDLALPLGGVVLDPFAGTGKIHQLAGLRRRTVGIELEPEWAATACVQG